MKVLLLLVAGCLLLGAYTQGQEKKADVSFKSDVMPIIDKHCLRCHAEDSANPSELTLDSYSSFMAGGKHGPPVTSGKPEESLLLKKLSADPPFGDQMPLAKKRPDGSYSQNRLSDRELQALRAWIEQGAKDN